MRDSKGNLSNVIVSALYFSRKIFSALRLITKNTLQIDAVFERNDKDKDGKLSKKEFTEMMCNHSK